MRTTDQGGGSGGCTEGQQAVRKGVWKEQREGGGAKAAEPYKEQRNTSQALSCLSVPLTLDLTGNSQLPRPSHTHLPHSLTLTRSPTGSLSLTREDGGVLVENEWGLEKDGWSPGALRSVAQQ